MPYTREKAKDFWFDFDNQTLFQRTPEIADAMARAYFNHGLNFDSVMDALRFSLAQEDHPAQFQSIVEVGQEGFVDLAQLQLGIMDSHLDGDNEIQRAYEDFGQGVLFDDRAPRPPGRRIHMMDGTPTSWVGYHRWHAFARAATLLGADQRWLHVNRCIALAWAIQSEANPPIDNANNPGLPEERLQALRDAWMVAPLAKLDWAFANHSGAAPLPAVIPEWNAPLGRYAQVQQLLIAASPIGSPQHLDDSFNPLGRFWELSYVEFMALPPIYGHQVIADPGPDRGARSALVKVLKGELEDEGIPRMPMEPNDEMDPAEIQIIQNWIDDDCPEFD